MARAGRTPFKNKERDRRYQAIIEAAARNPWGTMHQLPFPLAADKIREHERLIWNEARFQGYGRKVHVTRNDDGTYTLAFQLWDLATARQFVADRYKKTGQLPYNSRRPKGE